MSDSKTNQFKKNILLKTVGVGINILSIVAPGKAGNIALDIFITPRKGRVESYQKKFLKKFAKLKLQAGDNEVMTYDNGKQGKCILLCHGWESNSFRWRKLYRELKKTDFRVILMDAPAHGESGSDKFDGLLYMQMIKAAVDHYKPETIIGHSLGGYAAILYQGEHQPKSVKNMIIMASPDKFSDMTGRYFKMVGYSQKVVKLFYKVAEESFGRPPQSFNASDYAKSIDIPGLIIHDLEDYINLFSEGREIHNAWKKSKLVSTKGFGHSLEDPSVYACILEYIMK